MKPLVASLIILCLAPFAHAVNIGAKETICNYELQTVQRNETFPKTASVLESGRVKLAGAGLSYGPAAVQFGDGMVAEISASIATDMVLTLKVRSHAASKVIAQAQSLHRGNENGVFQGSIQLLSADVASIAEKNKISYVEASTSEELPLGSNFVLAAFTCF